MTSRSRGTGARHAKRATFPARDSGQVIRGDLRDLGAVRGLPVPGIAEQHPVLIQRVDVAQVTSRAHDAIPRAISS